MKNQSPFSVLRWMSLAFLAIAVGLFIFQLIAFSRLWANYPAGLTIGNVPVGRQNRQEAAQRILQVYSLPVELHYNNAVIMLNPSSINFEINIENMLAAAELERTRQPFWQGFWDYLWGGSTTGKNIPLSIRYSESRLKTYLRDEIAPRYDQPAAPAKPIPGSVQFAPGSEGTTLNVDRSTILIDGALRSDSRRTVNLALDRSNPDRPTFRNLEILLKQTIVDITGFDGVVGVYVADLQSGQEITFIFNQLALVNTPPDLAFTASSTIKIPIMVSAFRRLGQRPTIDIPLSDEILGKLDKMIGRSDNTATDWIMQNILDQALGPLMVTDDMKALGLNNTFLAGFFFNGAPMLRSFKTQANTRLDVEMERDPYSQTTAAEMGMLLEDIYQCADSGGGALLAVFPGEITQTECQMMIAYMKNDRSPYLILAGLPDGTEVAHKHGWVIDQFGIIKDMSDAAIVYTKSGNYVLTVYLYHPQQLVFDNSNKLIADISRAVYNYFNLPAP